MYAIRSYYEAVALGALLSRGREGDRERGHGGAVRVGARQGQVREVEGRRAVGVGMFFM